MQAAVAVAAMGLAMVITAAPAAAHGISGRSDLPLPVWQVALASACVVGVSFALLGLLWHQPRLQAAAHGRPFLCGAGWVVGVFAVAARVLGLSAFLVVAFAALRGNVNPSVNIAPTAVYITFWVGMPVLSIAVGDMWRMFNPMPALTTGVEWLVVRIRGGGVLSDESGGGGGVLSDESGGGGGVLSGSVLDPEPTSGHHWWAVVVLTGFVWLELAYFDSASPRAVAVFIVAYTAVMLVGAAVRGRGWARHADGFGVMFACFGAMGPLGRGDGRLRLRWPLAGLASLPVLPGTMALVVVVLGSTSFDGFTRNSLWGDLVFGRRGWELTAYNTVGLVFVIGVVYVVYRAAIERMAAVTGDRADELSDLFAPSLLPICAAYIIAHYFSLLIFEGQGLLAHMSDPFGEGWNLFGTATRSIDYTLMSHSAVAWVQTGSIVVGHILAVIVAHDRALERFPRDLALRSQYPMLYVMILYTFIGLMLMLG